jgi:hypothetical protein
LVLKLVVCATTTNKRKRNAHGNNHDYASEHPEVNSGEHDQHPPPPEESNDEGVLVAVAAVLNSSHDNLLTMAINQKLPQFVYSLLEARADPCFVDEKRVPVLNRACWERCAIVLNRALDPYASGPWDTFTPRMLLEYIIERMFLDQIRKGVKDREVGFKKQAFKLNVTVKFHAAQKFRADRPSRLHKRAAARAHHGNSARRLGLRKHGCGCSSCRDRQLRWRRGRTARL